MMRHFLLMALATVVTAASSQTLTVNLEKRNADVAPTMYGIFFEEINHAGDGGLYAELLQNRGFEEHVLPTGMTYRDGKIHGPALEHYNNKKVEMWTVDWDREQKQMQGWRVDGGNAEVVLAEHPLHVNTPHALRLTSNGQSTLVNEGYWGVAVQKGERYDLRFYLNSQYDGQVVAKLLNEDGDNAGEAVFTIKSDGQWNEYTATLIAKESFGKGSLALCFNIKGSVLVDYVSLFPQNTFKKRKNGLRKDLAETLADLHPAFMRWPGGCIVEGACYENRIRWKETLGDPMTRRGEWDLWGYRNSCGFGYHEFLQFCEDLNMKAMFVANAGLGCGYRCGDYTMEQAEIDHCLQDMRDAIEYAIGDPSSNEWAKRRADAGHPAPYPLQYVEIGNENNGDVYKCHLNYIYAKLKAEYPQLTFISTLGGFSWEMDGSEGGDMVDPHWYVDPDFFFLHNNEFDARERGRWDVYVGEYACNNTVGAGNMLAALSEATFIFGMERNGDIVKMTSYAPLLVNVNQPNWACNLIHFDNQRVMRRASYYVQQMMAENRPDYNLELSRTAGDSISGVSPIDGKKINRPLQFYAAGRDDKSGETILKVVNADTKPYRLKIKLEGGRGVNPVGRIITLKAGSAESENSFEQPDLISPKTSSYRRFGRKFSYDFAPLSLTILRIKTQEGQ